MSTHADLLAYLAASGIYYNHRNLLRQLAWQ